MPLVFLCMIKLIKKMSVENILVEAERFDVPQGGETLTGFEMTVSGTEMYFQTLEQHPNRRMELQMSLFLNKHYSEFTYVRSTFNYITGTYWNIDNKGMKSDCMHYLKTYHG